MATKLSSSEQIKKAKELFSSMKNDGNDNRALLEALGVLSNVDTDPDITIEAKNEAYGLSAVICCYLGQPNKATEFNQYTIFDLPIVAKNIYCMVAASYVNLSNLLAVHKAYINDSNLSTLSQQKREHFNFLINSTNSAASAFLDKFKDEKVYLAFDVLFDARLILDLAIKLQFSGVYVDHFPFYHSLKTIPWEKTGHTYTMIPGADAQVFERFNNVVQGFFALFPDK